MRRLQEILQKKGVLIQKKGVLIQPSWRALHNHADPRVGGIEVHPSLEHHHYRWRIAPT